MDWSHFPDLTRVPVGWTQDDETLRCIQVRPETHDVKTFIFAAPDPRVFRYRPGQFMTLSLDIEGEKIRRSYTLSSTPTRPDSVSITVKRVPGGKVSNWLHDNLIAGMEMNVVGPAGEFSCFNRHNMLLEDRPLLFLSGGSGITPLMSMSRALHDLCTYLDVQFVHAARTPQDVIFAHELKLLSRNMPRFRHTIVCEQLGTEADYSGAVGRVQLSLLQSLMPEDLMERDVYCCGPAPFMEGMRTMLEEAGFDMSRYMQESFRFEDLTPAARAITEPLTEPATEAGVALSDAVAAATNYRQVTFNKRGDRFLCAEDQTILQAATVAGLRMPFSCSNGMCGTCKTMKVSGEVEMNQNGGLRPKEVQQGWILPCCSKPLTDVVLDR